MNILAPASYSSRRLRFNITLRRPLRIGRDQAIGIACLLSVLVAEGVAVAHSPLLAAPLVALLVVALAVDIPIVPFLGAILLVRVLTDSSLSSATTRHSGSLNLSSAIALLFILIAFGLLIRRRRGVWTVAIAVTALALWTAIAVRANGASAETVREGVREASILAFGVIVFNARGAVTVPVATRLIQFAGVVPALVALYQLATHGGMLIAGEMRANGTFYHPDGAAMFFAIAATASLYQYFDNGRRRVDGGLIGLFAVATVATYSLTGLAALLVMILAFGTLRPGSTRLKLGSYAVAALIMVGFLASPLGAERLASESSSNSHSSLAWRFYKWETLLPEWERAPIFGQGLGTTTTTESNANNFSNGLVPHNEYLRYLVETGAFGILVILAAITCLLVRLFQMRRHRSTLAAATLGIAVALGCLFNGLADNTLLYTTTGYAAALILAAVLGQGRTKVPVAARQPARLLSAR